MTVDEERRVILVAPTGRDAVLIDALLSSRGITTLACPDVATGLAAAEQAVGAMIIADEALHRAASIDIGRFLEGQPPWSDVPILVLTRRRSPTDLWAHSLNGLGQVSILERPVGRGPLLTATEAALRARARQYEGREQLAELKRVGEQLGAANSLKDELLGLVSHELRTPLTGIVGCASILRRRFGELGPDDRKTLLRDIDDHATRLHRIIENMLVLSRAGSESETNVEPVLFQHTFPPMLEALKPLRGGRDLIVSVPPDLPPANVNSVFVDQVVTNLVRNSEKYAAAGQPVEVSLEARDDSVVITVVDRGAEFTQSQVRQMFEPFYREPEQAARQSGLGLGLAVCKRLTEVQGGSISARPRDGGGLEVAVSFPTACEDGQAGPVSLE